MRQLWISVAILAGMVLLLSWNMVHVHQLTEPMREDLSQAVAAAREEDWQKAEALTQKAQEHWQSNVSYLRFVQFHEEIDEVTVLLSETTPLWMENSGNTVPVPPAWPGQSRSSRFFHSPFPKKVSGPYLKFLAGVLWDPL